MTTARRFMMAFAAVIALLASSSATHAQLRARADLNKGADDVARAGGVVEVNVVFDDSTAPWLGFANVSETPANGGGPAFSTPWSIPDLSNPDSPANTGTPFDDDSGTVTVLPQFIDVGDDFWYVDNGNGTFGGPGGVGNKVMEMNLYQEVTGPFAGTTVTFEGEILAASFATGYTARLFISDFAPDYSSRVDSFFDITGPGQFSFSLDTDADPTRHVQWGIQWVGENVWSTDINDFGDVQLATVAGEPPYESQPLSAFCSDFEELVPDVQFSPIGDGWLFSHNQPVGDDYGYPNGPVILAPQGPQISNLADQSGDPGSTLFQENGGDDGSNQYLNIYSDYDNPLRMTVPIFDFVNNVFQEQTFTGADAALGETYTFSFDYAGGQDPFGVANNPDSTAAAFVRVLDNGRGLLTEAFFDTSAAPSTPMGASPTIVWEHGTVSVTMDPAWTEGGVVQFGFTSTSSEFEPTGVFYDNVDWANFVRGDANGDGALTNTDIAFFVLALTDSAAYAMMFPDADPDSELDMNCDGVFNNSDIAGFVSDLTGG